MQVAFAIAYILYILKDSLINVGEVSWTDALEAVYKMLGKCGTVVHIRTVDLMCCCSDDKFYCTTCQFCSDHFSTVSFTDYISVSNVRLLINIDCILCNLYWDQITKLLCLVINGHALFD